jgi:deoxyadenosine/deoxycytidine kinase
MKARIIEIIGPPGVGKSTIYQSLCKTWKPGFPWVYPDVLMTSKLDFYSFRKWLIFNLRIKLGKRLTKTIPVDYGMRFAGQQQDLANFCWKYITDIQFYDDEEINKRFRSAYFLFKTFCTYQAILENGPAKPCIVEEGFLQKSFIIKDKEEDDQEMNELLDEYLRLIPLPHAIIYIDTPDSKEIVKRLRGRSKVIASHNGKDDDALLRDIENWQQVQQNILEKLQNGGVQIVRINGKAPVKDNVFILKELLKKMSNTPRSAPANGRNETMLNLSKAVKQIF